MDVSKTGGKSRIDKEQFKDPVNLQPYSKDDFSMKMDSSIFFLACFSTRDYCFPPIAVSDCQQPWTPPLKSLTYHLSLTLTPPTHPLTHSPLHETPPPKTQKAGREKSQTHIRALNILRPPNPLDLIPTLLDRVNQRPDIGGHVVQQADFRHPSRSCSILFLPSFSVA